MIDGCAPLATVSRSGLVESVHFGHLVVCDDQGLVQEAWGDPESRTYLRSSAKPLQALRVLLEGTADRFHWTDEEVAVVCASHSAQPIHRRLVRGILAKAGLTVGDLQCGPHPPIDESERVAKLLSRQKPTAIDSNCSGKHAGMLACCVARGWDRANYRSPDHPLQQRNRETLAELAKISADAIGMGNDGCGVPTFAVSMRTMATAFASLARPDRLDAEYQRAARRVVRVMGRHPDLIAGTGTFGTNLAGFLGDRAVTKGGAEGIFCLGIPERGLGVALKLTDGGSRAQPAILVALLSRLLPSLPWARFREQVLPPLKNTRREVIGSIDPLL